ncbi:polysaccharide biosynthesis/export family protein [Flavobacterium cellulosilyticum]|uniref:Sugar transporter n=1 Tax=Flavobacterium cellulosilyticum TaxID=2541731 RepID=A0A4R5CE92_9FLAO|nr:polysaccharide biosynthesis/export family protein [Flavobacterium cellulosilyticum]TDD98371.1 sugar transporter [Flavobacterium cellulosilyticum]
MNNAVLYLVLGISMLFVSCIPNKDLIYLQNKNGTETAAPISEVMQKPYRLQINDVLSISIKANDPKLVTIFNTTNQGEAGKSSTALYFDGFTVDDHGNIRIPVLGDINAIGFTVEELQNKIEKQLLSEYFKKEANIFVTVKLAGFKYTITGEVGSVGTKFLFQDHVNIMEAIANSGDITLTGNRKAVTIIRQLPSGIEMHNIDLTNINALKSPYFNLQPNDFIYVKPLRQKSWGTGKTGIESLGSIMTLISLITTTILILKL